MAATELGRMIARDELRMAYQPIVRLDDGEVVGYEALVRGPQGSLKRRPDLLFAAARREDRVAGLDWACRHAAVRGAMARGLRAPLTLHVNVHPEALGSDCPAEYRDAIETAERTLDLALEIPERALAENAPGLEETIRAARHAGWLIVIDDLGSHGEALVVLERLCPDILKLDGHVTRRRADSVAARVARTARDIADSTGAVLLAEGLETPEQIERAQALGATLGQGWALGRETALPAPDSVTPPVEPALV